MTRETTPPPPDLFSVPLFVQQCWDIGWTVQLALWNLMAEPFCPPRHDPSDHESQLAIPEPIAENAEHGLFA